MWEAGISAITLGKQICWFSNWILSAAGGTRPPQTQQVHSWPGRKTGPQFPSTGEHQVRTTISLTHPFLLTKWESGVILNLLRSCGWWNVAYILCSCSHEEIESTSPLCETGLVSWLGFDQEIVAKEMSRKFWAWASHGLEASTLLSWVQPWEGCLGDECSLLEGERPSSPLHSQHQPPDLSDSPAEGCHPSEPSEASGGELLSHPRIRRNQKLLLFWEMEFWGDGYSGIERPEASSDSVRPSLDFCSCATGTAVHCPARTDFKKHWFHLFLGGSLYFREAPWRYGVSHHEPLMHFPMHYNMIIRFQIDCRVVK